MTSSPATASLPDLRSYPRVVVLTGAGISAPSGIKTYRAAGSGWTDPVMEKKSHANRYGMHLPELWQFWGALRAQTAAAQPNAAHLALASAEAQRAGTPGYFVVSTQNVDELHTRAGNTDVVELHGSIHRSKCIKSGCSAAYRDTTIPAAGDVPACPKCGRGSRPDVVLFGEQLRAKMVKALQAKMFGADLCIYVGTSGNVWPAADMVSTARLGGGRCVLVNAEPWDHPHPDFHDTYIGPAEELLPEMLG